MDFLRTLMILKNQKVILKNCQEAGYSNIYTQMNPIVHHLQSAVWSLKDTKKKKKNNMPVTYQLIMKLKCTLRDHLYCQKTC